MKTTETPPATALRVVGEATILTASFDAIPCINCGHYSLEVWTVPVSDGYKAFPRWHAACRNQECGAGFWAFAKHAFKELGTVGLW